MERLKNFELRYEEANFAQMGLAAYNINDYPTAVFYLEEALQRGTTYQAGGLNGEAVELLEGWDIDINLILYHVQHKVGKFQLID